MIDNPKAPSSGSRHSRPYMHLVGPNPALYTHPMSPESFGADCYIPNLIEELTENGESYKVNKRDNGNEFVIIPCLNRELHMMLDHYRAKLGVNPPSVQTILGCCVTNGLRVIESNSDVKELKSLVDGFNARQRTDHSLETHIHEFFSLSMGIKSEAGTRYNLPVTPQLKQRIVSLSATTGLRYYTLTIISAYACLIEQDEVPELRAEEWKRKVDALLYGVRLKFLTSRALIEELDRVEKEGLIW